MRCLLQEMFQYRLVKSQHIKGGEGIKDISNTCSRSVVVKHIIYKHNINFSYFFITNLVIY
jgi:hypothetical protein